MVAHHLAAIGASVGGLFLQMARAQNRAVRQHHRRLRPRTLILRDRDARFGVFDEQLHVAQMHRLAGIQPRFPDGFAVDERAVGGFAIVEIDAVVRQRQFAMQGRNRGMINAKLAIGIAANMIDAETQLERPVFQARCLISNLAINYNLSELLKNYTFSRSGLPPASMKPWQPPPVAPPSMLSSAT